MCPLLATGTPAALSLGVTGLAWEQKSCLRVCLAWMTASAAYLSALAGLVFACRHLPEVARFDARGILAEMINYKRRVNLADEHGVGGHVRQSRNTQILVRAAMVAEALVLEAAARGAYRSTEEMIS